MLHGSDHFEREAGSKETRLDINPAMNTAIAELQAVVQKLMDEEESK